MKSISFIRVGMTFMTITLFAGCSDSGDSNPTGGNNVPVLRAAWRGNEGIGQLLGQKCTPCHTSQSTSGFNVTTHANIMANGDIVAGNANDSYMVKKLTGDPNAGTRMPQGGPYFNIADIDTIKAWIQAGALDN